MATQSRVGWKPYVNLATATYLLDTYSGAAAAYSVRKLSSIYSGYALTVRRSQDNTSQNIGFNANGDLDTTSLLSFVGSNNISLYSEELDNAYWTKKNTIVTTNQTTAPDGTMTADLLSETATTDTHGISPNYTTTSFPAGTNWNISCYVKKGNGATAPDTFGLGFQHGQGADTTVLFSFTTEGAIDSYTYPSDSNVGSSMTSVGDGWYRCSVWGTVAVTHNKVACGSIRFNNNLTYFTTGMYTGKTTSNMYVWGYQFIKALNDTSVLTTVTYTKTTTMAAGNGYVSVWYDQSGNGRDLTQVTLIIQPQIVSAGKLLTLNGKPSLYSGGSIGASWRMTSTFGATLAQPNTMFSIGSAGYPGTGGGYFWGGISGTNGNSVYIQSATQIGLYAGSALLSNYSSVSTTQTVLFAKYNGNSSAIAVNAGTATTGNAGTQSLTGLTMNASYTGGNGTPGANHQEFILWNSDKTSERTGISNNINTYYSVY